MVKLQPTGLERRTGIGCNLTSNVPCGSVRNRAWTRTGTSLQQITSPSVHTMLDIKSNFLHLPIFSYVFD